MPTLYPAPTQRSPRAVQRARMRLSDGVPVDTLCQRDEEGAVTTGSYDRHAALWTACNYVTKTRD